jgi:hypothetical protein
MYVWLAVSDINIRARLRLRGGLEHDINIREAWLMLPSKKQAEKVRLRIERNVNLQTNIFK